MAYPNEKETALVRGRPTLAGPPVLMRIRARFPRFRRIPPEADRFLGLSPSRYSMNMKTYSFLVIAGAFLALTPVANAQQRRGGGQGGQGAQAPTDLVATMLQFDANQDGAISRDEVTDPRLQRLFLRADADQNGVVTRDELTAIANTEPQGGGFGGPMMGPPRPGEVLPAIFRQQLQLSQEQSNALDVLQREVDTQLNMILSAQQRAQLQQMSQMGSGGMRGGSPGTGGQGGQGGPGGQGGQRGFGGPGGQAGQGGRGGPGGQGAGGGSAPRPPR